jgi:hypothetical protein
MQFEVTAIAMCVLAASDKRETSPLNEKRLSRLISKGSVSKSEVRQVWLPGRTVIGSNVTQYT